MRTRKEMNVESMESISTLIKQGLGSTIIARILQRSESSVKHYINIVNFVEEGKPIAINPKSYRMDVVQKYCKKHGLKPPVDGYKPANDQQITIEDFTVEDLKTEDPVKTAINMLNGIGIQFHALAEYLYKNFVKENQK